VARVFASSNLVPPHLKGQVADCLIAYQIARRLNEEPLTVFQNIYVVSGRPGWKTEYVIARANKAGVFKERITWEPSGAGDTLAVTAHATLADSGKAISVTCDMKMAKAENWTKNAKYTSMPEHMLRWRSAAMLIRLYAPEVMLGMPVVEELETLEPIPMRDISPAMRRSLDDFASPPAADKQVDEGFDAETGEVTEASKSADGGQASGPAAQPSEAETAAGGKASPGSATSSEPAQQGTAGKPVTEAAPVKAASGTAEPEAAKAPTTEREYQAYAIAWIDAVTDGAAGDVKWKSDKQLRNRANVSEEIREELKKRLDDKVVQLKAAT
jgi:hypothetical protein